MSVPILTSPATADASALGPIERWFDSAGWTPFAFQRETWSAYLAGDSGLVHAPTGTGKSLAVWLGPVMEYMAERHDAQRVRGRAMEPVRVLWITPMRALANDTVRSLLAPVEALGLPWSVEKRTGDTSASAKTRQRSKLPTALVTTPESLALLLTHPDARETLSTLRCVVVDEWHELLSSKRGVQAELSLATLRRWFPSLRTWGLSATLGNLPEALSALVGAPPRVGRLVCGDLQKPIEVRTLMPSSVERFPWAGHLGLTMLPQVLDALDAAGTSLLFTNTRSQTELWFRAILRDRPEWLGRLAVHHGSIDRGLRETVEKKLREGSLKCVVCTSSLDLGVDFSPVEQVIQVGSPKGVARLLQRAGRSGHRPGVPSVVLCVPTQAMELAEFAAAREAIARREIEPRAPLARPLDVLAQHIVSTSIRGPFDERELLDEVRGAWSYRELSEEEWRWCLDFVSRGGPALGAYPQFARVVEEPGGWRVASNVIARQHRLSMGTITSDVSMTVQVLNGRSLGTIEETFVARLAPGDCFAFAGRTLELIRVRDMTAYVRAAKRKSAMVPRWGGGRSPLSSELAHAVRDALDEFRRGESVSVEMERLRPLLELQGGWSKLPRLRADESGPEQLLIEILDSREGHHVFLFPFRGRLVHEGLGALLAHRLAGLAPRSICVTVNDYGIELLSPTALPRDAADWRRLLAADDLMPHLMSCLNSTELTRRQFRDVARVAGLVSPGLPGRAGARSARRLQASSELFFDVFRDFDPGNLLLDQARREVLEQQLEAGRLRRTLEELAGHELVIAACEQLTPLAFPLWAERLRTQQVSSERWSDRVKRMALQLETRAERKRRPARRRNVDERAAVSNDRR